MSANANAVAVRPIAAPVAVVDDWTQARIDLVLQNYCNGAPEPIAMAFIALARRRRLSPEEKQIYLIKRGDKWSMETGIDGLRLIADRTEGYAGRDIPIFGETIDGHPDSASFTVYKIVQGQRVPFSAIAFWEEFRPKDDRQAFMWKQMPRHMLAKVAEAQALRSAFPADMSGLYIEEEMQQAGAPIRETTVREVRSAAVAPRMVAGQSPAKPPAKRDDPRDAEAKALGKAITVAFGCNATNAKEIGGELIAARYGADHRADAGELADVRAAVERWGTANAGTMYEWMQLIGRASTETMAIDIQISWRESDNADPFVTAAADAAVARFEEAQATQMAATDAAVDRAVGP